jgi:hypothetical protein
VGSWSGRTLGMQLGFSATPVPTDVDKHQVERRLASPPLSRSVDTSLVTTKRALHAIFEGDQTMSHRTRLIAAAAALTAVFAANSAFAWAPGPGKRSPKSEACQHQDCSCEHNARKEAPRAGRVGTWRA